MALGDAVLLQCTPACSDSAHHRRFFPGHGDWHQPGFHRPPGPRAAGKLSWISPISGRLMFVNRRGGRLCISSPDGLAMMVWLDRLRLHRDDDAFCSAMQGVVTGLDAPAKLKA
ncbi:DUF1631 family protein [Xanthomonas nasturtii]